MEVFRRRWRYPQQLIFIKMARPPSCNPGGRLFSTRGGDFLRGYTDALAKFVRAAYRDLIARREIAKDLNHIAAGLAHRSAAPDVDPFDHTLSNANHERSLSGCGNGRRRDKERGAGAARGPVHLGKHSRSQFSRWVIDVKLHGHGARFRVEGVADTLRRPGELFAGQRR